MNNVWTKQKQNGWCDLVFRLCFETAILERQDKALPENTKKATKFGLRNCWRYQQWNIPTLWTFILESNCLLFTNLALKTILISILQAVKWSQSLISSIRHFDENLAFSTPLVMWNLIVTSNDTRGFAKNNAKFCFSDNSSTVC